MNKQSEKILKDFNLKVTPPRLFVLNVLTRDNHKHTTPEQVYKTLSDESIQLSVTTIYKVFSHFAEAGLLIRHYFDGGPVIHNPDPRKGVARPGKPKTPPSVFHSPFAVTAPT